MTWSQSFVVLWAQFAVSAFMLLLMTRMALAWVKQPVDRIWLIRVAVWTAVAVPVLIALDPWPAAIFSLFSLATATEAAQPTENDFRISMRPVDKTTLASSQPGEVDAVDVITRVVAMQFR